MTSLTALLHGLAVRERGHRQVLRARVLQGAWPAGAAVLGCSLAFAGTQNDFAWRTDWFVLSQRVHASLAVALPVAVLFACWQGGMEARSATAWADESSPRGPLARALLSVAPSVLWPTGVYGAALATMFAVAWPTAEGGRPPLPMAAYVLGVLTGAVCAAHALGALLPLRVVPLVVAPTTLWSFGSTDVLGYRPPVHRPYSDRNAWYEPVDVWLPWLATALLLTVGVTVLVLHMRRRLAPQLLLIVILALSVLELLPRGQVAAGTGPIAIRCSYGVTVVCVTDDRASHRDDVAEVAAHFTDLLAGVLGSPVRYVATAGSTWSHAPGIWCCTASDTVVPVEPTASRAERFRAAARQFTGYPSDRRRGDRLLVAAVTDWLLPPPYRLSDDNLAVRDLVEHLAALPPADRTCWLRHFFAAVGTDAPFLPLPKATTR
ncbi:hypothetical protein [Streptomyces maremycinicus]|uniref:hypothetical protein n=1 Tax=Streptomyces maremycinicus TaxID=1679753 RepID=UPI0007893245|nr:hypothetical protein [Streptomyces sp. NBRC 110468]